MAFGCEYSSLAAIAKAEQTSSRTLMRHCRDRGISMLLVPMKRRGPQPFIRVVDEQKLAVLSIDLRLTSVITHGGISVEPGV
jgi:hypothetical protein